MTKNNVASFIRTAVFDLDGTLVDTAPDLVRATNHVLTQQGLQPVAAAAIVPHVAYGAKAMLEAGLRAHGRLAKANEFSQLEKEFIDYYSANCCVESKPYDQVPEILSELERRGFKLAVCTNKRESIAKALLKDLALDHYFGCIAGRDTFDVCKPEAGHVIKCISAANGSMDKAVMVGDSDVDVQSARAAGIPCVVVSFGYSRVPVTELNASAVIDHYREIIPVFDKLLDDPTDA